MTFRCQTGREGVLLPPQVNAVYRRLAAGEDVGEVGGFELTRRSGIPTDWGRVVAAEMPVEVAFYPPEFVLGKPEDSSCLVDVAQPVDLEIPAKTIRHFRDVRIVGWRSLLSRDGFYSTRREFHQTEHSLEGWSKNPHDGLIVQDGALLYASGHGDRPLVKGKTLFLSAVEPTNYGSFVFRMLPKLLYFLERGIGVDQLVVPSKTPVIAEAIEMLGLAELPLYSVREAMGLDFADVLVVDDFDLKGAMCKPSMDRLRALPGDGAGGDTKIYVSRRLNAHNPLYRPLLNEADIERVVTSMGLRVVFPECLRFRQQLALFANARLIVGPSGSGMLNALFSAPDARVLDIESFHSTVRQHARIYSSASHRYGFAFGRFDPEDTREPKFRRRWTASPHVVVEGIERLQATTRPQVGGSLHAGASLA